MQTNPQQVLEFWQAVSDTPLPNIQLGALNAMSRHGEGVKGAVTYVCHRVVLKRYGSVGGTALTRTMGNALGGIIYEVLYEKKPLKSIHLWFREYINKQDLEVETKVRCELQSRWFVNQVLDMIKYYNDRQPPAGRTWAERIIDKLEKN